MQQLAYYKVYHRTRTIAVISVIVGIVLFIILIIIIIIIIMYTTQRQYIALNEHMRYRNYYHIFLQ